MNDLYVNKDNATVMKAVERRTARIEKKQKERESAENNYIENVKQWLRNDKEAWVSEDYIAKNGRTDYYTGNSAEVSRLQILKKARICEDVAIYNVKLTMVPSSRTAEEPFIFKKVDGHWVTIHPAIGLAQLRRLDKLPIAESLKQEMEKYIKKRKCPDGSRFHVESAASAG